MGSEQITLGLFSCLSGGFTNILSISRPLRPFQRLIVYKMLAKKPPGEAVLEMAFLGPLARHLLTSFSASFSLKEKEGQAWDFLSYYRVFGP